MELLGLMLLVCGWWSGGPCETVMEPVRAVVERGTNEFREALLTSTNTTPSVSKVMEIVGKSVVKRARSLEVEVKTHPVTAYKLPAGWIPVCDMCTAMGDVFVLTTHPERVGETGTPWCSLHWELVEAARDPHFNDQASLGYYTRPGQCHDRKILQLLRLGPVLPDLYNGYQNVPTLLTVLSREKLWWQQVHGIEIAWNRTGVTYMGNYYDMNTTEVQLDRFSAVLGNKTAGGSGSKSASPLPSDGKDMK